MDVADLVGLGPTALAPLLSERQVSARELAVATLSAVERADAQVNAVVDLLADEAFDAADEADRRLAAGERAPLLGVPIAVKNDLDVAGRVSRHGSLAATRPAPVDGPLVRRLKEVGAVPVASTTLPELAIFGFTESRATGITRNPHALDHTPGGSSGGSAALVAAGALGLATAADGAGSIRIPAACCGLVGFKPTLGPIPDSGSWLGLSTQGCVTRTVADTARYLDAVGMSGLVDATGADPVPLRIGLATNGATIGRAPSLHGDVRQAVAHVGSLLSDAGHDVCEVTVPYDRDSRAFIARYLGGVAEVAGSLDAPDRLEPRTKRIVRMGRAFGPRAIEWSRRAGDRFGATVHDRLGVDVLLTPVMSGRVIKVGHFDGKGALRTLVSMNGVYPYTAQWNHANVPAVSVPVGATRKGLPLAAQLIGRRGDDARLMSLTAQVERLLTVGA